MCVHISLNWFYQFLILNRQPSRFSGIHSPLQFLLNSCLLILQLLLLLRVICFCWPLLLALLGWWHVITRCYSVFLLYLRSSQHWFLLLLLGLYFQLQHARSASPAVLPMGREFGVRHVVVVFHGALLLAASDVRALSSSNDKLPSCCCNVISAEDSTHLEVWVVQCLVDPEVIIAQESLICAIFAVVHISCHSTNLDSSRLKVNKTKVFFAPAHRYITASIKEAPTRRCSSS